MKALILVGGFGTRLRPLTLTLPKPLVPFANKPMILHQIEALVKVGVKDIVLAVNYRPEVMMSHIAKYEEEFNVKITFSVETEPLGTAGPLALARGILAKDNEPFFVLNSDVICEFPFAELLEFHKKHGKEGTIMVTKVEEPSKYGVVVTKEGSLIDKFVEKPVEYVSNRINAGIYIFNPTVLNRIELRPTSIEKETFPSMASDSQLHAMDLDGFWMDVGQPKDYLIGIGLYLNSLAKKGCKSLAAQSTHTNSHSSSSSNITNENSDNSHLYTIIGNVLIHPTAKIGYGCKIGPNVTIGENVVIENGVRLSKAAILDDSKIQSHAWIQNSIIGWKCNIGKWSRLEGVAVLGDDVAVSDEVYINGGCILPHKTISSNIPDPKIVM